MAWVEVQQSLIRHPKTKKATRELGIPRMQVVGHLVALWAWAVDYAPDGEVDRFTDEELADGAEWEGEPSVFRAGIEAAGFVVDGSLHDWMDYSGGKLQTLARKRAGNRVRQQRFREERHALVTRDGNAPSRVSHGHTGPNQTNLTRPTTPPPPPATAHNGHAPRCAFAEEVGAEKFAEMTGAFTRLSPQLDEFWLRQTVGRFEAEGLSLAPPAMRQVLKTVFLKAEDALGREESGIRNPRAWVKSEIERELMSRSGP